MFPGISYGTYLKHLEEAHQRDFSDEAYNNLASSEWTKSEIELFMAELKLQYEPVKELLAEVKLKMNNF